MARRFPTLDALARRMLKRGLPSFPVKLTPEQGVARTFQRGLTVRRRGLRQVKFGPDALEARAAQDVRGTLPERIMVAELRRRGEEFLFAGQDGANNLIGGVSADFVILSRLPNIALQVMSDWNRPPLGTQSHNELKAVLLSAMGFRYAELWSEDIEGSPERLEQLMDDILGTPASITGFFGQPPEVPRALGAVPLEGLIAAVPEAPPSSVAGAFEGTFQGDNAMMQGLSFESLAVMAKSHHAQHESGGSDAITTAEFSRALSIPMRNSAGAIVPRGTVVVLDTATTQDNAFTTSATQDSLRAWGVALEEIASTGRGQVAVAGYVQYVRVAAGTTRYQFLRQSTTAGIAEGTAGITDGTFAIALSSRDATLLTVEAFLIPKARGTVSSNVGFNRYTANATWTKPAGATWILVECIGAGGGGGGGPGGSGGDGTGGGGGGGGVIASRMFPAASVGATETITVGAGGAGGAAGADGTAGGNSTFGSRLTGYGGGRGGAGSIGGAQGGGGGGGGTAGAGGNATGGTTGTAGAPAEAGASAGNRVGGGGGSGSGGNGEYGGGGGALGSGASGAGPSGGSSKFGAAGGGGGGGHNGIPQEFAGGAGGDNNAYAVGGGGTAGIAGGGAGGAGTANPDAAGDGGGGGGGARPGATGGAGGAGGAPGGGGGGGGAGATTGGVGGDGARGEVRVWAL